jgi:hypothetical protein
MKIYKMVLGVFLTLILSTSAYSATLVIEDGQLVGADGITFDGYTGSVRFVDGSCADIFNGCDEPSDLVFETLTSTENEARVLALSASSALLTQVFDANPLYDLNIELTFGCEQTTDVALVLCGILTPYSTDGITVLTANMTNRDDTNRRDTIGSRQGYFITDSTLPDASTRVDDLVYAAWTVTPVPLPAAVWLFATGLLGLIGIARKKAA